ncbi:MAG TPA: MarR family transcriptional regulator [Chloroflexota bacterium]|nr:MarR family transcriptional regulator [Chloroflexota bacterium]
MDPGVGAADLQALAEFRYQVRRYLHFSETAAKAAGLLPQQYQALGVLKGAPSGKDTTVAYLAERMQIQHHSAVGLVDRLVQRGLVERVRSEADRRQVLVRLTERGDAILSELVAHHLTELRAAAPSLVHALNTLTAGAESFWPPTSGS